MRRWAVAALAVVAGCSRVFGLDPPERASDASPEANVVSGRIYMLSFQTEVEREPYGVRFEGSLLQCQSSPSSRR
jgi:hypothetical protein